MKVSNKTGSGFIFFLIISLPIITCLNCQQKTFVSNENAISFKITKFDPSDDWGETVPLQVSTEGVVFRVTIEPEGGTFSGWVELNSRPGRADDIFCNPPVCDEKCNQDIAIGKNLKITGGPVSICAKISLAYSKTNLIVRDIGYEPSAPLNSACKDGIDNDGDGLIDFGSDSGCAFSNDNTEEGGSGITGISPDIHFANPRVENIQGYASSSPFERESVTINYSPLDHSTGRLVVTRVSSEGFYFTDIDPMRPGAGYNSLYAYNFNTPWGLRECDVLQMVDGIVGEFLGFTELNYPGWRILPACSDAFDNDGDTLVDMSDPDCTSPDDYSESPLPDGMDSSERVPVPNSPGECPIPEAIELTAQLLEDAPRMESLESSLVQVSYGKISSNFTLCDLNGDGVVEYSGDEGTCKNNCDANPDCTELSQYWQYGQWKLNAQGEQIFVVSRDSYPDFDPMRRKGETLKLVRGTLKQIEFINPPWIIEVRCKDDLVLEGEEILPVTRACVPLKPRGEPYDTY